MSWCDIVVGTENVDIELENDILRQIFLECERPLSSTKSTSLTTTTVSISSIIDYILKSVPQMTSEILTPLRKSLENTSPHGLISWDQFREASQRWISDMKNYQKQDGNNNFHDSNIHVLVDSPGILVEENEYSDDDNNGDCDVKNENSYDSGQWYKNAKFTSNANQSDSSLCDDITESDITNLIVSTDSLPTSVQLNGLKDEMDLLRTEQYDDQNTTLQESLENAKEIIKSLQQQYYRMKRNYNQVKDTCKQLEQDNDEQRELLNEITEREKFCVSSLRKTERECRLLKKKLENAETEILNLTAQNEKLQTITKEKTEYTRRVNRILDELEDKERECNEIRSTLMEVQEQYTNLQEEHKNTISDLRSEIQDLRSENFELKSLSLLNNKSSLSPSNSHDSDTFPNLNSLEPQNSLLDELKASGFTTNYECNSSLKQELDEELFSSNNKIHEVIEEIESITQKVATSQNKIYLPDFRLNNEELGINYNVDVLKQKISYLNSMITNVVPQIQTLNKRNSMSDAYAQVCIDSLSMEQLKNFGILNFTEQIIQDLNNKRKITLNVSSRETDPFLSVSGVTSTSTRESDIVKPVVADSREIIQDTANLKIEPRNCTTLGNSSFNNQRSIFTYRNPPDLDEKDIVSQNSPTRFASREGEFGIARTEAVLGSESNKETIDENTEYSYSNNVYSKTLSNNRNVRQNSDLIFNRNIKKLKKMTEPNAETDDFPHSIDTAKPILLTPPRRKLSVFARSFEVDPLRNKIEEEGTLAQKELQRSQSNHPTVETSKIINSPKSNFLDKLNVIEYRFPNQYRSPANNSISSGTDSSNSPSPLRNDDSMLDLSIEESPKIDAKLYLAPAKLKLPQVKKNTESILTSKDVNEDSSILECSPVKVEDSRCPLSVGNGAYAGYPMLKRLVAPAMSSREESSDSETDQIDECMQIQCDSFRDAPDKLTITKQNHEYETKVEHSKRTNDESKETLTKKLENIQNYERTFEENTKELLRRNENNQKDEDINEMKLRKKRRQKIRSLRRCSSDSDNVGRNKKPYPCSCSNTTENQNKKDENINAFPSLTNERLQKTGLTTLDDMNSEFRSFASLPENELEQKYTGLSLGFGTDRLTLTSRAATSIRQRNQSEKNFSREMHKMRNEIQELALLCNDRESIDRMDRVKHQLEMIVQCVHQISRTAETLGAVHQERRLSRAILLADKYLHLLRSRSEKLASEIAETKRILLENNIVVEEHPGELGDDFHRIRYRSGLAPTTNRTMIARRRASIATISRPLGSIQDMTKADGLKQRNSISGRLSVRRPSFTFESQKWETEKLDRTDSSSSIGELREIFEHIESRKSSREENNNVLRIIPPDNIDVINPRDLEEKIQTSNKKELFLDSLDKESISCHDSRLSIPTSSPFEITTNLTPTRLTLWCILIFFFGFYVKHVISLESTYYTESYSWWSIEEILSNFVGDRKSECTPS